MITKSHFEIHLLEHYLQLGLCKSKWLLFRWSAAERTQLLVVHHGITHPFLTVTRAVPTQATLHDLASEDEDAPIPVPIHDIGDSWSKPQEPAKTAWRQGSSPELLLISNAFNFNMCWAHHPTISCGTAQTSTRPWGVELSPLVAVPAASSGKPKGDLWCLHLREWHLWELCLCKEGLSRALSLSTSLYYVSWVFQIFELNGQSFLP